MSIERQLNLRYFKYLHDYVTQLQCYFFFKLIHSNWAWTTKGSMHTYIKPQVTNLAVYVNKQLSEP